MTTKTTLPRLAALAAALCLLACANATDGSSASDGATAELPGGGSPFGSLDSTLPETGPADTGAVLDIGADVAAPSAEIAVAPDAAAETSGVCDEAGCPCSANSQCQSGFCIETADGQQCAKQCVTTCPVGFKCGQASGAGGDIVGLCVPAFPRLCEPCAADSDCNNVLGGADSRCMPYTDPSGALVGGFCGGACSDLQPCPNGYSCKEGKSAGGVKSFQCHKTDLVCGCDVRATKLQLATACNQVTAAGTCGGKRACGKDGLTACDAPAAATEACNAKDDNCNGLTDETTGGLCDDSNPCTYDNCIVSACQHPPATGACNDGTACTTNDKCIDGACTGSKLACDSPGPCVLASCDAVKGCQFKNNDGADCDDGNVCTAGDLCKAGACLPGAVTSCDDANPCTNDSCDKQSGCAHGNNALPCDDGNVCTTGDLCGSGACAGTGKLPCNDGNACTADACDKVSGCEFAPKTGPCSDGSVCSDGDTCSGGACVAGSQLNCDDKNPCTSDTCSASKGCLSANNDAACSDGDPCTLSDACKDGACAAGSKLNCNDGNPCTDDSCGKGGCLFAPNAGNCTDNNACTVGDGCKDGTCLPGKAKNCADGEPCTDDLCDPAAGCANPANSQPCSDGSACTLNDACAFGQCNGGAFIDCEDNNACTDDTCNKLTGCVHAFNTGVCNDGNACTSGDACKNGGCLSGKWKVCSDNNPCTDDTCDPASGCAYGNNQAACSDGNVCTQFDTCAGGTCVGGTAGACDDGSPCTTDGCDKAKGCVYQPNTAPCDDGNQCTSNDACSNGKCAGGAAKNCDDNNACTADSCDPVKGCQNVGNSGAPPNPKALGANNISATGFTATWSKITGAVSYQVDVSAAIDFSSFATGWKNVATGDVASLDVSGLQCAGTYYYRVRAVNACGAVSLDSPTTMVNMGSCANIDAGNFAFGTPCPGPKTDIPITKPAGVQPGNLLIATITTSSPTAINPPPGWTQVGTIPNGAANCSSFVFWHFAAANDPAIFPFTATVGMWPAWVIMNFTGNFSANPIDASTSNPTNGYTVGPLTTSVANQMVVMVANSGNGAQTWQTPVGMNATNPGNINCTSAQIFWGKQAAIGSTGTKTAKGSVTDTGAAYLLTLH